MCTIDRKDESESRGAPLFNGNAGSVGAGLVGGARGHARSDGGHWHLLENANIKLTSVISNIIGFSGRRIFESDDRGRDEPDQASRARFDASEITIPGVSKVSAQVILAEIGAPI